jgi:hypothetical protein
MRSWRRSAPDGSAREDRGGGGKEQDAETIRSPSRWRESAGDTESHGGETAVRGQTVEGKDVPKESPAGERVGGRREVMPGVKEVDRSVNAVRGE